MPAQSKASGSKRKTGYGGSVKGQKKAKKSYQAKGNAYGLVRAVGAAKEKGYVDAVITSAPDSAGSVQHINIIPQGAAVTQRVGKKVVMTGLQVRGRITNTTLTGGCVNAALIVIYDKRPTGALPTIATILASASPFSMNNDDGSGRFSIIRRWDITMNGGNLATTKSQTSNSTVNLNDGGGNWTDMKARPVVFTATAATGAIGTIEEGALYWVAITDSGASTCDVVGQVRVRFLDV